MPPKRRRSGRHWRLPNSSASAPSSARSLIVVVPTGTGWVDPAAMDTVEYLHHGDVASVALQYSYLTSWLSLLVEPNYGAEAGEALFKAVYGYWTTLPKETRPKLYLHGLSLGAMNSERSADLFDVIGDPFQGALWSGPPFESAGWKSVTAGRDPGSPGLAAAFPRQLRHPLHRPEECARHPRCDMGADADRLSAICQRPGNLLRSPFALPGAGLDEAAARSGCLALSRLVSGGHHAAAGARYGDGDDVADGLRPCLCAGTLYRCVDGGDRSARAGAR